MNNFIMSRSLLLEQLESRCLLAGGIFENSAALGSTSCNRSAVDSRSVGSALIVAQTNGRSQLLQPPVDQLQVAQRHATHSSPQSPTAQPISDQIRIDPPRLDIALLQQSTSQPSIQLTLSFRPSIITVVSDSDDGQSSMGGTSRLGRELALSTSADLSQATTVATEKVEGQDGSERWSVQFNSAVAAMSLNDNLASQIFTIESISHQYPNHSLDTSAQASDPSEQIVGGLIEIPSALRYEFGDDSELQAEEPWKLNYDALQQLRSTENETNDDMLENNNAIDVTMATWFGNTTGLIDDIQCAHDLPSNLHELTPSVVDVVLDATVGLHRSVGVIANGDTKIPPNSFRDSILAAIAEEYSSSFIPLPEQTPARLPAIAYPGVAIVVSTLAFAGRHRRKDKLEPLS